MNFLKNLFKKKDKKERVRNLRRLRYGTAATALTAIVIAVFFLLNILVDVLANRYPITWDLSANKVFTLSEESIDIAKAVKDEVEIVVFADKEMVVNPTTGASAGIPEFDTTMREFHTALQQYRNHSGKKVSFQFINPNQEPAKFAAYEDYDVSEADILFLSGERYKVANMADLYALDDSNYYTTGTYEFASKVEKVLASNIYSLQGDNDRVIQVLVGHEEDENTIAGLKDLYELNGYTFEEINITGSAPFNKNAEVMLIAAPAKDYSAAEIKRVQEWVFNKGSYNRHLIVYLNPTARCANLHELLDVEYGIQVTDQLILETDLNRMQNYQPYYPVADIPETAYTKNSVSTGRLYTPLARRLTTSLEATAEQEGAIGNLGVPLNNYPESARVIKLADYNKENTDKYFAANKGEYPLTSMIASIINSYDNNKNETAYGSVVVSGCPAMAYPDCVQNGTFYNEELLLNAINAVTGHEDSVSVSNKVIQSGTVTFSTTAQLILGLGIFTIGIPLVVGILCLVMFLRRKNL